MPEGRKTPSAADFIETGIVCAVAGFLVVMLIEHLFGDPWRMAAIRGAVIAVSIATVLTLFNVRKARSRAPRS